MNSIEGEQMTWAGRTSQHGRRRGKESNAHPWSSSADDGQRTRRHQGPRSSVKSARGRSGAEGKRRQSLTNGACRPSTDLNVNWTGADVTDEEKGELLLPAAAERAEDAPAEPSPEGRDARNLEPPEARPPTLEDALLEKEAVRVGVEIEACEGQDHVVGLLLMADHERGKGVEVLGVIEVGREDRVEEDGRDGEEGDVPFEESGVCKPREQSTDD